MRPGRQRMHVSRMLHALSNAFEWAACNLALPGEVLIYTDEGCRRRLWSFDLCCWFVGCLFETVGPLRASPVSQFPNGRDTGLCSAAASIHLCRVDPLR